ncbi:MAG: PaaI family thioesterase [Mariprofundus sp.]
MRSNLKLLGKLRFLSAKRRFELYPPFFFMRVKVVELADDWSSARFRLPLNWVSANIAGNMYGGYQASLADPIPAIACIHHFPGYRVATKKLEIDFIRTGSSDLILHFDFPPETLAAITQELERHGRATPCFDLHYTRADGKVCTRIKNTIAIRPAGYLAPHEERENEHDDSYK